MLQKVAIVTGSAQGIGRAIALRLALDGYNVGINDIPVRKDSLKSLATEIQRLGRKTSTLLADVGSETNVEGMVKQTVEELGGLDVMVSNAGICRHAPILDTPTELWDKTHNVNLRGTFLCFKYAAKQMIEQGRGGRIIGASSIGGFSSYPTLAAYGSTKAGMRALTHSAAREWGSHRIMVNCYAPGCIDTPMSREGWTPEAYEQAKAEAALSCHGTPEDIAGLVSFLASKDARFITGQTICVDGGRLFM